MFKPKYLKQGKLLRKGVKKFLHYKRDIISPEKLEQIEQAVEEFDAAMDSKDRERIETSAKRLTGTCEKAVPSPPYSGLRENLEVIFVAVVIAVGIRAYVLQPFKIPTGSMMPTLNGIVAYNLSEEEYAEKVPGGIGKAWNMAWAGRKYFNEVMGETKQLVAIESGNFLKFFPYTKLHFEDGSVMKMSIPLDTLKGPKHPNGTGFGFRFVPAEKPRAVGGAGRAGTIFKVEPQTLEEGTLIARGYVDTGDQVLVDKISYHFRNPRRGEVFVFSTKGITGITGIPDEQGSQHYIKRLVGVPGDKLEVGDPMNVDPDRPGSGELFVNGARATEKGMVKVMDEYPETHPETHKGYVSVLSVGRVKHSSFDLTDKTEPRYVAMGDNSSSSSDSRSWGTVPEVNVVGPAFVVYWPFKHHWGRIR